MPGTIYDKSTRELFKDFLASFVPPQETSALMQRLPLGDGGHFTRAEILGWFQEHYPKLKGGTVNAHLTVMSTNAPSRVHHNLRPNGAGDLLFQIDRSKFRLYVKDSDPAPIYRQDTTSQDGEGSDEVDDSEQTHEFAYERDLKNFLATNLQLIRPSLALYKDGEITGVEFPVGGRYVDILAVDNHQDLIVIELKVSKGYDRAMGQLLRYMAWIERNLAEAPQKVRGMIVARSISEDLRLATSRVNDVELFEYELSISLKPINNQ